MVNEEVMELLQEYKQLRQLELSEVEALGIMLLREIENQVMLQHDANELLELIDETQCEINNKLSLLLDREG